MTVTPTSASIATVTIAFGRLVVVGPRSDATNSGTSVAVRIAAEQQLVDDVRRLVRVAVDAGERRDAERVRDRRDAQEAGDARRARCRRPTTALDRSRLRVSVAPPARGRPPGSRAHAVGSRAAPPAPPPPDVAAPPDGEEDHRRRPSATMPTVLTTVDRTSEAACRRSASPPSTEVTVELRAGTSPTSGPRPRHARSCSSGGRSTVVDRALGERRACRSRAPPARRSGLPGVVAERERDLARAGREGDRARVGEVDLAR